MCEIRLLEPALGSSRQRARMVLNYADCEGERSMKFEGFRFYAIVALLACALIATRVNEIDLPLWHRLTGHSERLVPARLHLGGEFVESNLGSALEPDGSVTVRMIAQKYLFVPRCVIVPAGVPVHFRITSADATHTLMLTHPVFQLKAVPGSVTEAATEFSIPGNFSLNCHEFCGLGHTAMRAELEVVPRDKFPQLALSQRGQCADN